MMGPDLARDAAGDQDHLNYAVRRRTLVALSTGTSLANLANVVGATDARLLWHLRKLRDDGPVESSDDEGRWVRTSRGNELLASPTHGNRGNASPQRIVDDFEDARLEVIDGLYREGFVQANGEHRTRLSAAQVAQFRDRLLALIEDYFAPGAGDRSGVKYGFHWMLTPVDLHPLDDDQGT